MSRITPPAPAAAWRASSLLDGLIVLGLCHRLSWRGVDRLLELADADAAGGALARAELEAQLAAARTKTIYLALGQRTREAPFERGRRLARRKAAA